MPRPRRRSPSVSGVAKEAIVAALASFKSVKRRLEVRAEIGGITVIEDFAHHPTAIRETLRALRSVYPQARLWAVLEPRSNTLRRKVLEADLVASLRLADRVVLAGVYQQQRIPDAERLHPEDVVDALNAAGTPAELCPMPTPSSTASRRNLRPAMWWRSFPMAASTASTRSCRRGFSERFPDASPIRAVLMISALLMLGHILVLGIPAAILFIPVGPDHRRRAPLYNVAMRIARAGLLSGRHSCRT